MNIFDKTQACNCVTGEPYIDSDGVCRCSSIGSGPNQLQCGPDEYVRWLPNGDQVCVSMGRRSPLDPVQLPPIDAAAAATIQTARATSDGTIFGLPGWLVLAAAATALYLFSSSDNKKES